MVVDRFGMSWISTAGRRGSITNRRIACFTCSSKHFVVDPVPRVSTLRDQGV
jgi:hypothetical protein